MRYVPGQNYITLKSADNTFTYSRADQWAFVGNPFDGFKIFNRVGGGARLISSTTMSSNNGRDTNPYVSTEALPSGFIELWDIHTQSTGGNQTAIDGGFAISQHGNSSYKMNNRAYGNDNSNDRRMAYWTSGSDNGSTFTVNQELPAITLNEFEGNYYASFYVDYPVKGVSAPLIYTGTVNGNMIDMEVIDDKSFKSVVPAGVGVVLVCANEPSPVVPQICSEADAQGCAKPASDLTGTMDDLDITGNQANYLVLGRSNEETPVLGFYRPTATTIPANRAYINNSASAVRGFAFNFGGEQTVIDATLTESPDAQQPVYDLSGRRVVKAAKGIYIRGGKKIYVK